MLAAFLAAATGVVLQTLLLISVIPPRMWNRHAMPMGLVLQVELLAIALSYRMRRIQAEFLEREKSEKLLLTMLPAPIAQRLKNRRVTDRRPPRRGHGAVRRHRWLYAAFVFAAA